MSTETFHRLYDRRTHRPLTGMSGPKPRVTAFPTPLLDKSTMLQEDVLHFPDTEEDDENG